MLNWIVEIELIICIKMNLALHKPTKVDTPWNPTNQPIILILKEERKDGLFSWFNGISTFVGYLMPKLFS